MGKYLWITLSEIRKGRRMEIPDYMHGQVQGLLNDETAAVGMRCHWVIVLGLIPRRDGDKWYFLWGDNIQEGVVAFGDSPAEAVNNFDNEMYRKAGQQGKKERDAP